MTDSALNRSIWILLVALLLITFPFFQEEIPTRRQITEAEAEVLCRLILEEHNEDASQCAEKEWRRQRFTGRY